MNNKSAALGKLGRYEESIECIDAVLEANPKYVDGWHNKGKSLKELGREEEAEECFAKAKELEES
jgi:tetratricopeptide (TPR) repeat protein